MAGGGGDHFSQGGYSNEDESPFKPPNDEEVFVTRETEKRRRKEQKEQAKSLKIWEKNTATSAAPLRRVKDRDISPARSPSPTDEEKRQGGKRKKAKTAAEAEIDKAKHIARSRV